MLTHRVCLYIRLDPSLIRLLFNYIRRNVPSYVELLIGDFCDRSPTQDKNRCFRLSHMVRILDSALRKAILRWKPVSTNESEKNGAMVADILDSVCRLLGQLQTKNFLYDLISVVAIFLKQPARVIESCVVVFPWFGPTTRSPVIPWLGDKFFCDESWNDGFGER